MAGVCSGASTRVLQLYPLAIYVHCSSHKLNLCVAASCKLPMVGDIMSQFEAIALFFYLSDWMVLIPSVIYFRLLCLPWRKLPITMTKDLAERTWMLQDLFYLVLPSSNLLLS